MNKKVLVTGCAGLIGFSTSKVLLQKGYKIYGVDNLNDYYSVKLKKDRIKELYKINKSFKFYKIDISDEKKISNLFKKLKIYKVLHLAAQAGVRYSLENPQAYIKSNLNGFFNILQCCKDYQVSKFVYASSSSVYGKTNNIPFKENQNTNDPEQLYAATKKSNELMAHAYGHLYSFKTTGLRFFTVYGPWGRPDMAYYSFVQSIFKGKAIEVFNNGKMERDFTYIDDIVDGVVRVIEKNIDNRTHYKIYNIGNNKTVKLLEFISTIEIALGKKAVKLMRPNQPGDVPKTWADISALKEDYGYNPDTNLSLGIPKFIDWYKKFIKIT